MGRYPNQPNEDLLELIPPDARVVLDVGCGSGALGAAYRRRNGSVRLLGIERDPGAAAIARQRLDQVFVGDVEDNPLPFGPGERIDCIIYGDVLQHLRDPWAVVRRQLHALVAGGAVLICIPNVEHWGLLERLFRGSWGYEPSGLLDGGHLRWFSRATVARDLEQSGLAIDEIRPRVFGQEQAKGFVEQFAPSLERLGVEAQAYFDRAAPLQYVIRAHKPRAAAAAQADGSTFSLEFVSRGSDAPVFFLPALMAGGTAGEAIRLAPNNLPPVERPYACVVTVWDFWRLDPARCASAGFPYFTDAIEPAILDDVRTGRAVLLLDLTNEGPAFEKSGFDHIHDFVDSRGLPAERVIWLAQNRAIEAGYKAAYGARRPSIRFLYYDFYVKMLAHFFSNADWRSKVMGDDEAHLTRLCDGSAKDHVVLCLNATPRTHRVLAISALMYHGIFQDCLVSFGGLGYEKGSRLAESLLADVAHSPDYAYLTAACSAVCRIPSLQIDGFLETGNRLWNKIDTNCYYRTYLSLVTETDFTAGDADRVTEKILKPFCLGHPVVTLGNPGSIRTMRDWGFSDFGKILDQGYDQIADPATRFRVVFDGIIRQIAMVRSDPVGWLGRMREISSANIAHSGGGFIHAYHERCEVPLLVELSRLLASRQDQDDMHTGLR
jgi:SAM-dependent methyltransferase